MSNADLIARTEAVHESDLPKLYAAYIGNRLVAHGEDKEGLWSWAEGIGLANAVEVRTYVLYFTEGRFDTMQDDPLRISYRGTVA